MVHRGGQAGVGAPAITAQDAMWVATKFLLQHHSVISSGAILDGTEWVVTARVGILPGDTKTVRVGTVSGRITHCT